MTPPTPDLPAEATAQPEHPLDRLTAQTCPARIHPDWAVDSEDAHACPWCEIEKLDRDEDQLIGERDHLHEVADRLAYAIAPVEVIGEHSDHNDPWDNAYEELFNQRAAVRAAAFREAAEVVRAHVGSPLASALFNNGVEFAAGLLDDLATTAPTTTATPEEH